MNRSPDAGIRFLARTVDYADGAEERLLEIFDTTEDLSSWSDDLAARIVDWPTRYHLARERSNLLRPLRLDERQRVLDVGAGTGAIARYLGETGARVVALEGSPARARAAAARCRDLPTVEVVCGDIDDFEDDDGFDLVCLVGVLEYAGAGGRPTDPESFLHRAVRHLRPGGSLLVAIENQLGLKYLLGFDEDHLGRPWVGIEGYPAGIGVRTFSRRRLAALLESCGLDHQRWFYPFPDYKMPTAIVADAAYREPDAASFVDHVAGDPTAGHGAAPVPLCDHRRAHRVALEAGLGRELANSFLVLASAGAPDHGAEPDPGTLAWLFGGSRRRRWIRHQVVESNATGRRIRSVGRDDGGLSRSEAWLSQRLAKDEAYIAGGTVLDAALEACRGRDADALRTTLVAWRSFLDEHRTAPPPGAPEHPYLSASTREVLPPDHLDLSLSNFVVGADGLVFVDREWLAEPAVDADLVSHRALWLLAQRLVTDGGVHPWDPSLTVPELTVELGRLAGLASEPDFDRLADAEGELLGLVTGRDRTAIDDDLRWLRSLRPTEPQVVRNLPLARLRDQAETLGDELELERAERGRLETEVAHERATVARLADELGATHERLAAVGARLEEVAAALDEANRHRAQLKAEGEAARLELQEFQTEHDDRRRRFRQLRKEHDQTVLLLNETRSQVEDAHHLLRTLEAENTVLRDWRAAFEERLPVRLWRRLQRLMR